MSVVWHMAVSAHGTIHAHRRVGPSAGRPLPTYGCTAVRPLQLLYLYALQSSASTLQVMMAARNAAPSAHPMPHHPKRSHTGAPLHRFPSDVSALAFLLASSSHARLLPPPDPQFPRPHPPPCRMCSHGIARETRWLVYSASSVVIAGGQPLLAEPLCRALSHASTRVARMACNLAKSASVPLAAAHRRRKRLMK